MLEKVEGEGEQPGSLRTATGKGGSQTVERLKEVDPARHFYRYVLLPSAMPVADYEAELRVRGDGDHASVVVWSSDFRVTAGDEEKTAGQVRQFFNAGLDSLQKKYE